VLTLDCRDVDISAVTVNGDKAPFAFGAKHDIYGTPLNVTLPGGLEKDGTVDVCITFTSDGGSAAQWLDKEQTADKKHPYIYTQCQAIHGAWFFPYFLSPLPSNHAQTTIHKSHITP
jgi:leukotriene-A4 hydrolase